MSRLVRKSDFAEQCGVSRAAVTKACKAKLSDAVSGSRIDLDHPAARAYYEIQTGKRLDLRKTPPDRPAHKRGRTVEKENKQQKAQSEFDPTEPPAEDLGPGNIPEHLQKVSQMTILDVVRKFGTHAAFQDWLKSLQVIEAVHEKRLKNAITEGQLVNKEQVKRKFVDPVDAMCVRLLTDGVKTLVLESKSLIESGADEATLREQYEDIVGSIIRPVKDKIQRATRDVA